MAEIPVTRFALPGGSGAEVLAWLEGRLGPQREVLVACAASLGMPDPFHLLPWLAANPAAAVRSADGEALTPGAAEAALIAAGPLADLAALYRGQLPGAEVRSVPVDDGRYGFLRWEVPPEPAPVRVGRVERWSAAEIGEEPVATLRCLEQIPGGVAIGSDYGLTIWRGGRFHPFPWPAGCRREARRVEAMAYCPDGSGGGALWIGTMQNLLRWDLSLEAPQISVWRHGEDREGGWDDLLSMLPVQTGPSGAGGGSGRPVIGYRTRLEGGMGPADALCLARDPAGVVFAGTRGGEIRVVDGGAGGGGPILRLVARKYDGTFKGHPIRHLAFAGGALHVAGGGAWRRFDGCQWEVRAPEPTALHTDEVGRLWAIVEGRVGVWAGGAWAPLPIPVERPWALCAAWGEAGGLGAARPGALWVGAKEGLYRAEVWATG